MSVAPSTFASTQLSSQYAIAGAQTEPGRAQVKSSRWMNWMDHPRIVPSINPDTVPIGAPFLSIVLA